MIDISSSSFHFASPAVILTVFSILSGLLSYLVRFGWADSRLRFPAISFDDDHELYDPILQDCMDRSRTKILHAISPKESKRLTDGYRQLKANIDEKDVVVSYWGPTTGSQFFFYNGNIFFLWKYEPTDRDSFRGISRGHITIWVLARSTQPIEKYTVHIKRLLHKKESSKTKVFIHRPEGSKIPWSTGWSKLADKKSRRLDTVYMCKRTESQLLHLTMKFFDPELSAWKEKCDLGHRLGLFVHGPPGTGKTTLALGLAGTYNLDVYHIILKDPELTDGYFARLMSNIPRNCLVLFDDIDAARTDEEEEEKKKKKGEKEEKKNKRSEVSFSALLSAIDGVTSSDDRILVMTTNHPDKIDPALRRAGRIDMDVHMGLAVQDQMQKMFHRLFEDDPEIEQLSKRFAKVMPENTFSTAEIQGMLVNYYRRPLEAVEWFEKNANQGRSMLELEQEIVQPEVDAESK